MPIDPVAEAKALAADPQPGDFIPNPPPWMSDALLRRPPSPVDEARALADEELDAWTGAFQSGQTAVAPPSPAYLKDVERRGRYARMPARTAGEQWARTKLVNLLPGAEAGSSARLYKEVLDAVGRIDARESGDLKDDPVLGGFWSSADSVPELKGKSQAERDQALLDIFSDMMAEESERESTLGAGVVAGVTGSVPLIAEFIASGGTAAVAKKAARSRVRAYLQKRIGSRVAGAVGRGAGWLASGATRTGMMGAPHVVEGYLEGRAQGESPGKALKDAVASTLAMYLAEESGGALGKLGGKAMSPILARNPALKAYLGRVQSAFAKAYKSTGRAGKFVDVLAQKGGLNSFVEELGEERVEDLLNQATGSSDEPFAQALFPGWRQLAVEAGTIGALKAPQVVTKAPAAARAALDFLRDRPDAAEALAAKEAPTRKDFEEAGIPGKFTAEERAQVAAGLRQMTPEEAKAFFELPKAEGETQPEPAPEAVEPEATEPATAPRTLWEFYLEKIQSAPENVPASEVHRQAKAEWDALQAENPPQPEIQPPAGPSVPATAPAETPTGEEAQPAPNAPEGQETAMRNGEGAETAPPPEWKGSVEARINRAEAELMTSRPDVDIARIQAEASGLTDEQYLEALERVLNEKVRAPRQAGEEQANPPPLPPELQSLADKLAELENEKPRAGANLESWERSKTQAKLAAARAILTPEVKGRAGTIDYSNSLDTIKAKLAEHGFENLKELEAHGRTATASTSEAPQSTPEELSALSWDELKARAKPLGVKIRGTRQALVEDIVKAQQALTPPAPEATVKAAEETVDVDPVQTPEAAQPRVPGADAEGAGARGVSRRAGRGGGGRGGPEYYQPGKPVNVRGKIGRKTVRFRGTVVEPPNADHPGIVWVKDASGNVRELPEAIVFRPAADVANERLRAEAKKYSKATNAAARSLRKNVEALIERRAKSGDETALNAYGAIARLYELPQGQSDRDGGLSKNQKLERDSIIRDVETALAGEFGEDNSTIPGRARLARKIGAELKRLEKEAVGADTDFEFGANVEGFEPDAEPAGVEGAKAARYAPGAPAVEKAPAVSLLPLALAEQLRWLRKAGGFVPRIFEHLQRRRGKAGQFRGQPGAPDIKLSHDIFIGPLIRSGFLAKGLEEIAEKNVVAEILEKNPELKLSDLEIRKERVEGRTHLSIYRKDSSYAGKVMAHEIGHWDDFMPDETMARGNILGRIAKLKMFMKKTIDAVPTEPPGSFDKKDQQRMRAEARKAVGEEPLRGTVEHKAWLERVQQEYGRIYEREIIARGLITRDQVMKELRDLTVWWEPFEPGPDKYTKYRFSVKELYADALSVLLNAPAALKERAPVFYHAFMAYAERNAEARAAYEEIQEEIRSGGSEDRIREDVRAGIRRGDEAHRQELEKLSTPTSTIRDNLGTLFLDRFYRLARLIRRAERSGRRSVNPMDVIDTAKYTGSQIELYANRLHGEVAQLLEKANLTETDLGEYLIYQRAINERAMMANPVVGDKAGAERALKRMGEKLGPKSMEALEEARKRFRKIREELILSQVKAAGIYDKELMDFLLANEHYATFEVVDYIDRQHGKGTGLKLFRQVGTLKDVSNPVSATMATDISLLWSTNWNRAKEAVAVFLAQNFPGEIAPAEMRWDGKKQAPVEPAERGKGLLAFQKDGKVQAFNVDAGIASAFDKSYSEDIGGLARLLRLFAVPSRLWFTNIRPGFQLFNVFFRDPLRTLKNIPGLGFRPDVLYRHLFSSLKAAGMELRGKPDEVLDEMRRRGLLISVANIGGMDDFDTQTERLLARYSKEGQWSDKVSGPFQRWLAKLLVVGQIGEHANKRAAFVYLKQNQEKLGFTDAEIDHAVRHWAGSPSFITGGKATPITNNIFLFSNAMFQGWRSDLDALRANPKAVAVKTLAYSIMPKAVMLAFATGAMEALLRAMGAGDDDEGVQFAQAMHRIYQRASSYDMANYTIIPLGEQKDGKAVYLRIPQDETGRVIGGFFCQLFGGQKANPADLARDAVRYMGDQGPGFNPVIGLAGAAYEYLTGVNPYDDFRRREAVPEREFTAGGMPAHKAFGKWLWNQYGGSFVYKFDTDNPVETRTRLQKFLQLPFMGDIAGRFIKITDYGLTEAAREAVKAPQQERARKSIEVEGLVKKRLSGAALTPEEERTLAEERAAAKRYTEAFQKRGGEQVERILTAAKTDEERRAILDMLRKTDPSPAVNAAVEAFAGGQLYDLTAPKPERRKGERLEDFRARQVAHEKALDDAGRLLEGIVPEGPDTYRLLREEFRRRKQPLNSDAYKRRAAMLRGRLKAARAVE